MPFAFIFFAIPLLPWMAHHLYRALRYPRERRANLVRLALWVATLAALVTWHAARAWSASSFAQDVVNRVERFKQDTGHYPQQLAEVGITSESQSVYWLGYFPDQPGKSSAPDLFYAGEWVIYSVYRYDFATRTWILGD